MKKATRWKSTHLLEEVQIGEILDMNRGERRWVLWRGSKKYGDESLRVGECGRMITNEGDPNRGVKMSEAMMKCHLVSVQSSLGKRERRSVLWMGTIHSIDGQERTFDPGFFY